MKELLDEFDYLISVYVNPPTLSFEEVSKQFDDIQNGNYESRDLKHFTWYTGVISGDVKMYSFYKKEIDYVFVIGNCGGMINGYSLSVEDYRAIQINNIIGNDEL